MRKDIINLMHRVYPDSDDKTYLLGRVYSNMHTHYKLRNDRPLIEQRRAISREEGKFVIHHLWFESHNV